MNTVDHHVLKVFAKNKPRSAQMSTSYSQFSFYLRTPHLPTTSSKVCIPTFAFMSSISLFFFSQISLCIY